MSSLKTPEFSIKMRSDKLLKNIFKTYKEFGDTCDLFFTPERLIIKSIAPGFCLFLRFSCFHSRLLKLSRNAYTLHLSLAIHIIYLPNRRGEKDEQNYDYD